MQYSPKLKKVMAKIQAILNEEDIAGSVVLHTPGHAEYFMKVDPSYSCAKIEGDMLRIKAKLQEDFQGDKKAWTKKMTDTVNMISLMADSNLHNGNSLVEMMKLLREKFEIEETDHDHSSHTTQNN